MRALSTLDTAAHETVLHSFTGSVLHPPRMGSDVRQQNSPRGRGGMPTERRNRSSSSRKPSMVIAPPGLRCRSSSRSYPLTARRYHSPSSPSRRANKRSLYAQVRALLVAAGEQEESDGGENQDRGDRPELSPGLLL